MKTNYILGAVALAGLGLPALGAGVVLDSFDTFTSGYATGASGFLLQTSVPSTATDAFESLAVTDTDSSFVSVLTRKVELVHQSGTATSTLANGQLVPFGPFSPQGHMLWGNQGSVTQARLTYNFAGGVDLTAFSQIDFSWLSSELGDGTGGNVLIKILSTVSPGIEAPMQNTFTYGFGVNFTYSASFFSGGSGWVGNPAVLDSVKSIQFTFSANGGNVDYDARLNTIGFSNPNVPEVSALVPVVAFAFGVGFVSWRRRSR